MGNSGKKKQTATTTFGANDALFLLSPTNRWRKRTKEIVDGPVTRYHPRGERTRERERERRGRERGGGEREEG
jgi:hypothetical protein